MSRHVDDEALLRAIRSDPAAFEAFYRRWAIPLHGWLRRQVDPETANDLTAETFAQVLVSVESFRGEGTGSAVAWLWGIARNLVRQQHRRARLERSARDRLGIRRGTYDTDVWDDADARAAAAQLAGELAEAMGGLSEDQRRAVRLRVVSDLDFSIVASVLDCAEPAARMRVSRALHVMRSRLQGVWL